MAERMLRRGLPRLPGGEPWPPADAVATVAVTDAPQAAPGPEVPAAVSAPAPVGVPAVATAAAAAAGEAPAVRMRRGLPRVVGGEPWPQVSTSALHAAPAARTQDVGPSAVQSPADAAVEVQTTSATDDAAVAASVAATSVPVAAGASPAVRRGLPRVVGGEPWPPAGTAPVVLAASGDVTAVAGADATEHPSAVASDTSPATATAPAAALVPARDVSTPLPWKRTVWNGTAPRRVVEPSAPTKRRPTWTQALAGLFAAAALGVLAGAAVAFVRALLRFPFMQDFLTAFPGEYDPAFAVAPGFPAWVGWQHFFNVFLMVLIIRSGLRVRTEKRPTVFWTPRGNSKGKISLTLWFHQSLDILWLVNGVVFVVLLIVSGHWARIVPTSWEVFPNALSAALQYVSFDWPTEHGWVNYNSLQQLAYFTTVFIAAPLAAVTGFRMSGMWPKKAERLSKLYPVEWARALHFPVMLYFVAFIIMHVALVMLTGFLRNLNHMYASQEASTWTGFWVFVASLVVIAGGWFAARPLVLAPIAKAFGSVSGR